MQTVLIDGKKIRDNILLEIKSEVQKLPFAPLFCDILVGSDPVSSSYVRLKEKFANSVGIKFRSAEFSDAITTDELVKEIENLNRVPHMCGIIVQLPLPSHIDKDSVLNAISESLDVDCLGKNASDKFFNGTAVIGYPTALACMKILDSLNLDLSNKNIVVLGTGRLVGSPVSYLLRQKGLKVESINSTTENKEDLIKNADVIVSAMGKGKFLKGDMVKEGVIVVDAGTSEEDGGIVGDVDLESMYGVASFMTPTPGGVGPVTVAMLLNNVLMCAKNKVESNLEN